MNPSGINTPPVTPTHSFNPEVLLGDLQDVRAAAAESLKESFKLLATALSGKNSAAEANGLQELEAPVNISRNVNDMTLRIGLLQDALNQLMQQVSRTEIKMRMNELQKENQKELQRFEEQMAKAAEAAEKAQESQKKGNIFEAVSNWIQAAISVVSAVFTLISAVGQILTNPVGAAGLIVAGVALIGVAAVQITLAIDATMRAAGQEGFLSETQKEQMQLAAQIMGYIAIAGSMIGLVGGIVVALGQAGKAAGALAGKEIGRLAATKLVATGMKEAATKTTNMTIARVAKYAFEEAMKPLTKLGLQMALVQIAGQSANAINKGVSAHEIAKLDKEASDLLAEADLAEAAAKAIAAQIAKLRALIEQMQEQLEDMVEQGQQTLSIIFGAIDESASSMTRIHQSSSA